MTDKRKYKGKRFINYQYPGCDPETIDEFDTYKEARTMLNLFTSAMARR